MNRGGPQGGLLGILEYLAQSNKNANCVEPDSRFKFVDDLTTLEKISILMIGLASHNIKQQVPNDINENNLFIPSENLKSQEYINQIQAWTINQKMELNEEKTKAMVFNFTRTKQFSTRLTLKNKNIETVKHTKLLGTIISDNLKWNKNTSFLVKKAYSRMELLRKVSEFAQSRNDRLHIYKMYVRSVVEQSCTVWHSSLTRKNTTDLERVQRVAVKIITNGKYSYKEGLKKLSLPTLKQRREHLCARFAIKCLRSNRFKTMFKRNIRNHNMKLRYIKKYKEANIRTNRLYNSAIPYMQRYLNSEHMKTERKIS